MVIVILGVLAVFAAPRIFSRSDIDIRGFHDTTLAYLRFAQKTAIAQRRTVCVSLGSNSVSLRIANGGGTFDCAGGNGVALNGPDGNATLTSSSASYGTGASTTFGFDGLGRLVNTGPSGGEPLAAQTIVVASSGKTITVEAATGYVHD